jgi:dTDP-4-amino-4,6-dideoxygalactose transaminase
MPEYIPFNRIYKNDRELTAVESALKSGCWRGDGPAGKKVEAYLRNWLPSNYAFLTTSCTHALEMAIMTLDIGAGDEVIMPGFTFVSTANAVRIHGAKPVFAEIRSSDLTLDPEDVARKITPATKAIVPVHYAGVSVDFDGIREAVNGRPISIIEDAAQAAGAFWNGRALGTVGDIGCFSFHDTKNITCGEGGAFLTQDDQLAEKAEWIREKGTNRSAYLRGEVDKYTWVSTGSSYVLSDLLAAVLQIQLEKKEKIRNARKAVWNSYYQMFETLAESGCITLPVIPDYATSNYHIFHFHVKDPSDRDPLIKAFQAAGIGASFHYVPLHNAPYARKIFEKPVSLPNTERLADTLIRLPLYPRPGRAENRGRRTLRTGDRELFQRRQNNFHWQITFINRPNHTFILLTLFIAE